MAAKACLEGHSFDLETLAELFTDGDLLVGADGNEYYLMSPSLDEVFQNGQLLRDTAEALLRRANGIARALEYGYRPVGLTGRFIDADGKQHHVVVVDTAETRSKAYPVTILKDGVPQDPPPSPAREYFEAARTHPDVGEVMDLLGAGVAALDWFDLFKIFEIVRSNVGGNSALVANNLMPRTDLTAFTASANRPSVSGAGARHARMSGDDPARTMTLHQARGTISQLVVNWLDSL